MSVALSLLKFRYHLSFAGVVLGALLFATRIDGALAERLALLYVAFNVLLYGGIYTFNDIADRRADAAHPRKRLRPVASGRVPLGAAFTLSICLVAAGMLMAAWLFSPLVLLASGGALAINAAYSCGGRNVPCLDILLNSAPHPVRFLMGVLLVERTPPIGHLAAWLCLAGGLACVRRLVEKDAPGASARSTLAWYSDRGLVVATYVGFAALLALAAADRLASPGFYTIVLTGYVLLVIVGGGRRRPALVRSLGAWLWLR